MEIMSCEVTTASSEASSAPYYKPVRAGEMAPRVRCLPGKPGELGVDSQHLPKEPGTAVHPCTSQHWKVKAQEFLEQAFLSAVPIGERQLSMRP